MRLAPMGGMRADAAGPGLGSEMLIACWHCSLCLIRFTVEEGAHCLSCSRCSLVTKVTVSQDGVAWRIQTGQA